MGGGDGINKFITHYNNKKDFFNGNEVRKERSTTTKNRKWMHNTKTYPLILIAEL